MTSVRRAVKLSSNSSLKKLSRTSIKWLWIPELRHWKSNNNDVSYNNLRFQSLHEIIFAWLCSSESELNSWLDGLPCLLTEKKISIEKVKCIANIARCNLSAFIQSLDGYVETIMSNIRFCADLVYLNNFIFPFIVFQIIYLIFISLMRIKMKKPRRRS